MSKTDAANRTPLPWHEALKLILESTSVGQPEHATLLKGLGLVCARDVHSPISVPPFDNSSMDGYAVRAQDVAMALHEKPVSLTVIGEAPAGRPFSGYVGEGQAVEIMTGAPLPAGADTVVRVEDTNRMDGAIVEIQVAAKPGTAIRRAGADTAAGDVLLHTGCIVDPAGIALLASCGISHLSVHTKPTIALAVGGDEVIPVTENAHLLPGEIFDSNSPMLVSLFATWGYELEFLGRMPDNPGKMREFMERGLKHSILVTVGGVSMGKHDYVRECLSDIGATEHFWKINQQPGGPMLYATAGNTQIFGLPGNPVSSYVCADIYVQAALRKARGLTRSEPAQIAAELTEPLKKPHHKVAFIRCKLQWREGGFFATSTGPQDSNRIRSLVGYDGYVLFPEEHQVLEPGEQVNVLVTNDTALGRVITQRA